VPSTPDPTTTTPRLRLTGISKRFGARAVLTGVDLDVAPGSIVLLAGSNGSGKTTLLRCVAGLARHAGRVELDGQPVRRRAAGHASIGYLPQSLGLPTWATVAEVLELFGRLRGSDELAVELPEGFLPPLDQPVGELSGGQRQRVAFAVALLGRPSLLLLDEPAANLDDDGRAALVEVLAALRDTGTSVLIAAPSPGDLNGLPDRTVRLVDGEVVADRALHAVVSRPPATHPVPPATHPVPPATHPVPPATHPEARVVRVADLDAEEVSA
jgi:ABC-type multidrug transport system ATPase subunit